MNYPVNRIQVGACHQCGNPIYQDQPSILLPNKTRYHISCHKAKKSRVEIEDSLRGELL